METFYRNRITFNSSYHAILLVITCREPAMDTNANQALIDKECITLKMKIISFAKAQGAQNPRPGLTAKGKACQKFKNYRTEGR